MFRSTTPVGILEVELDDEELDVTDFMDDIGICHVTLKSEDGIHKITYDNPEIDSTEHQIRFRMTQEETLRFNVGKVKVQAKIKLKNGFVTASEMTYGTIDEILEEQIL